MNITLYGIKNCDTVKKAKAWLDARHIDYDFHDYKIAGLESRRLTGWCKNVGWQVLFNRAGTTFRGLPETAKQDIDQAKAITLMLASPSLIKRPVLEQANGQLTVGFKPEIYAKLFGR